MRKLRAFTAEFKRQVVEEMLSGTIRSTQLYRRYNVSSGLLYHRKKTVCKGQVNEPNQETSVSVASINWKDEGEIDLKDVNFKKSLAKHPQETREKREFIVAAHRSLVKNLIEKSRPIFKNNTLPFFKNKLFENPAFSFMSTSKVE